MNPENSQTPPIPQTPSVQGETQTTPQTVAPLETKPLRNKRFVMVAMSTVFVVILAVLLAIILLKDNKAKTSDTSSVTQSSATSPSDTSAQASSALDTERKADINALQSALEEINNNEGSYPTLQEINTSSYRSSHVFNVRKEALEDQYYKDPTGTSSMLVASPQKGAYAYEVKDDKGNSCTDSKSQGCSQYTLTAILNDGTTYQKKNLY